LQKDTNKSILIASSQNLYAMKSKILLFCLMVAFLCTNCKKEVIKTDTTDSSKLTSLPFENDDLKIEVASECIPYNQPNQFYFFDENNGVILKETCYSQMGGIYVTQDKGLNWKKAFASDSSSIFFNDIKIIDNKTLIASGIEDSKKSIIVKSTDWGRTWQKVAILPNPYNTNVTIGDNQTLYAYNNSTLGTILKSNDLGQTWNIWNSSCNILGMYDGVISAISKSNFSLKTEKGRYLSKDAGMNWKADFPTNIFPSYSIHFKGKHGFGISRASGNFDEIYKTTDEGENWSKVYSGGTISNNIKVVSPTIAFAFGQGEVLLECNIKKYGSMIYTKDEGKTWKEIDFENAVFSNSTFYDEKHGYFIAWDKLFKITLK
jgi:photosystem II stability/assembly factor-like uncharacterized protein